MENQKTTTVNTAAVSVKQSIGLKVFLDKVLSGTATGIIIGLIPNAVLSAILKLFGDHFLVLALTQVVVIFQVATPLIIGTLIAYQFEWKPLPMMVVGGASFVGSGVVQFDQKTGAFLAAGTGDIINTMLTASLTIGLLMVVGDRFGSASIILTPLLIGTGGGLIGLLLLPYVKSITYAIGVGISTFTDLQPVLMSLLICCSFAVLIISPISTVAIGMAIQLNGLSAGAAAMGVAATTIVLIVNSWKINKSGVTLAIALGAMKMMMPNLFRRPIILAPVLFTAALSSLTVPFFHISGTPASAGFGLVGLVGPLTSFDLGLSIGSGILAWILIPLLFSFIAQFLFEKIFRWYDRKDVFTFLG